MSSGRVCETDRPDVNGSAYECTCEWAQRAKQGGTAGYDPVPAEMQGQVFYLSNRRNYENNIIVKTMVNDEYKTESGEDGVLPQPFTIHHSLFTKTEKEK